MIGKLFIASIVTYLVFQRILCKNELAWMIVGVIATLSFTRSKSEEETDPCFETIDWKTNRFMRETINDPKSHKNFLIIPKILHSPCNKLIDYSIRNHLYTWYFHYFEDPGFPIECRSLLTGIINRIYLSLSLFGHRELTLQMIWMTTEMLKKILADMRSAYLNGNEQAQEWMEKNADAFLAQLKNPTWKRQRLKRCADVFLETFAAAEDIHCNAARIIATDLLANKVFLAGINEIANPVFLMNCIYTFLCPEAAKLTKETELEEVVLTELVKEARAATMDENCITKTGSLPPNVLLQSLKNRIPYASKKYIGPKKSTPFHSLRRHKHRKIPELSLLSCEINVAYCQSKAGNAPIRSKDELDMFITLKTVYGLEWSVRRKYIEIKALNDSLLKTVVDKKQPIVTFPKWKGSTFEEFRSRTQDYLQVLVMSAALADCSFMRQFLSKNMRIRANKVNKKADYVTNLGPVSKRSSELNPYHTEFGNGSSDDENISDYESATEEIPSAYPITEDEKLTECSFQGSGYSSEQEEVKSENYISDRHTRWIIEQAFSLLEGFFALTYKSWTLRRSILQLIRSILQRSTTRMDTIKLKINQFCNTFLTGEYLAEKLNDLYLQLESPNTNYVPLYGKKEEILILLKECLVPDMLQSIVGSTSSSKAVEIVFTALQDEDLMQGIFIHWFAGMLEIINRKARRCKV